MHEVGRDNRNCHDLHANHDYPTLEGSALGSHACVHGRTIQSLGPARCAMARVRTCMTARAHSRYQVIGPTQPPAGRLRGQVWWGRRLHLVGEGKEGEVVENDVIVPPFLTNGESGSDWVVYLHA